MYKPKTFIVPSKHPILTPSAIVLWGAENGYSAQTTKAVLDALGIPMDDASFYAKRTKGRKGVASTVPDKCANELMNLFDSLKEKESRTERRGTYVRPS